MMDRGLMSHRGRGAGKRRVRTEVVEGAYLSGKHSVHEPVPQWAKTENGRKKNHTDVPTLPTKVTLQKKKKKKKSTKQIYVCMCASKLYE